MCLSSSLLTLRTKGTGGLRLPQSTRELYPSAFSLEPFHGLIFPAASELCRALCGGAVRIAFQTFMLLAFLACLAVPCFAGRTLKDELGRTMEVPDHPHRVICLVPSV